MFPQAYERGCVNSQCVLVNQRYNNPCAPGVIIEGSSTQNSLLSGRAFLVLVDDQFFYLGAGRRSEGVDKVVIFLILNSLSINLPPAFEHPIFPPIVPSRRTTHT